MFDSRERDSGVPFLFAFWTGKELGEGGINCLKVRLYCLLVLTGLVARFLFGEVMCDICSVVGGDALTATVWQLGGACGCRLLSLRLCQRNEYDHARKPTFSSYL